MNKIKYTVLDLEMEPERYLIKTFPAHSELMNNYQK